MITCTTVIEDSLDGWWIPESARLGGLLVPPEALAELGILFRTFDAPAGSRQFVATYRLSPRRRAQPRRGRVAEV